jgi:hypothetical protein
MSEETFLSDAHFVDELIKRLIHDRQFLETASHLLSAEDFSKLDAHEGNERKVVAGMALDFWNRYREPLGPMLRAECLQWSQRSGGSAANKARFLEYADTLKMNGHKPAPAEAVLEKVKQYKIDKEITKAMLQMQSGLEKGLMTPDLFMAAARNVVDAVGKDFGRPKNIFSDKELELRIARRQLQMQRDRFPVLLIDPIDRMIRIISRRHLGLILAPYKRGKTTLFVWLGLAYALQGLNVLHFTLEDPREDIEDRYDSAITALPTTRLAQVPEKVRARFKLYKRLIRSKVKVVDGTNGDTTIGTVENTWERERNNGFTADVVLIDYDDEIRPMKKRDERRMEFADIYRDYRSFLGRNQLIGWVASQTTRRSEDMKIISGKEIAEDISKIRKASFAMSMGKGEWGDNSVFLWVAAHRYDKQYVGAHVITDYDRGIFYDRDETLKREKIERAKATAAATKP